MSWVNDVKLRALDNILNESYEGSLRKIQRWYSKEFSTPLPDVMDLPLEELLLTYYECEFEEVESKDGEEGLIKHAKLLTETLEERVAREKEESEQEAEFERLAVAKNEENARKWALEIKAQLDSLKPENQLPQPEPLIENKKEPEVFKVSYVDKDVDDSGIPDSIKKLFPNDFK